MNSKFILSIFASILFISVDSLFFKKDQSTEITTGGPLNPLTTNFTFPTFTTNTTIYTNGFEREHGHKDGQQLLNATENRSYNSTTLPKSSINYNLSGKNLLQVAESLGLDKFINYIKLAGLTDLLTSTDPVTVFAPKNEAFDAMDYRAKNSFGNKDFVEMLLKYHISKGSVITSTDMKNDQTLDTMNGTAKIRINIYKNLEMPNKNIYTATGAIISIPDKTGSSGVLHVIDSVLLQMPILDCKATLQTKSQVSIFSKDCELNKGLSSNESWTILAPTDTAIKRDNTKLTQDSCKKYIVSGIYYSPAFQNGFHMTALQGNDLSVEHLNSIHGGMFRVNNATIFVNDIPCTDGVIHTVNGVW